MKNNLHIVFLTFTVVLLLTACHSSQYSVNQLNPIQNSEIQNKFGTLSNPPEEDPLIFDQVGDKKSIQLPDYSMQMTLSPNSQWLALSAGTSEISNVSGLNKCNIYVSEFSSPSKNKWIKLFSDTNSLDYCPKLQFSPDGNYLAAVTWSQICFFSTNDWKNRECYQHKVWSLPFAWSPDSKGFAAQFLVEDSIVSYLYPDGNYSTMLSADDVFQNGFSPTKDAVYSWGPTWSPDGKSIAFIKYVNNLSNSEELWIENVKTKQKTKLGQGNFDFPKWSPKGANIALIGDGLFIYSITDNSIRKVQVEPAFLKDWIISSFFEWAPSGNAIALNLSLDPRTADGFVVDINSGIAKNLGTGNLDPMAWSKDGYLLLFSSGAKNSVLLHEKAQ